MQRSFKDTFLKAEIGTLFGIGIQITVFYSFHDAILVPYKKIAVEEGYSKGD